MDSKLAVATSQEITAVLAIIGHTPRFRLDAETSRIVEKFRGLSIDLTEWIKSTSALTENYSAALRDILAERAHQISLGYDAEHDDGHFGAEIVRAALARIQRAIGESHYSTSPVAREKLVDATAMLIAEIERLDRLAERIATSKVEG